MRILHFCNYADLIGGAEVYAHGVVEALRERGEDVALFGASPDGETDRPGLRVIQRPAYDANRLVEDPAALHALREYVQRFRPDVLHVHNVFSVALDVLHYLMSCGTPVVHTIHDFQLLCPNSWCVRGDGAPCPGGAGTQCFLHGCQENYPYDAWRVLLTLLGQRIASAGTSIALAPSSYLAERLRAHGWRDVRHLPYFVELPAPSAPQPRSSDEVLYVGRLQPEKGVGVLLDAMPTVLAGVPTAHLTVVGGGAQAGALQTRAVRLGIAPSVRFLTHQPRAAIVDHYAAAAVCVLPSIWTENSPLVAYECLQAGLPILGSRSGGIPELIDGCGITFEPGDSKGLAEAILRFLRLPADDRERMSLAARARARPFGRDAHIQALQSVYSQAKPIVYSPGNLQVDAEFLAVFRRAGEERASTPPAATLIQVLRSMARSLRLPKIIGR